MAQDPNNETDAQYVRRRREEWKRERKAITPAMERREIRRQEKNRDKALKGHRRWKSIKKAATSTRFVREPELTREITAARKRANKKVANQQGRRHDQLFRDTIHPGLLLPYPWSYDVSRYQKNSKRPFMRALSNEEMQKISSDMAFIDGPNPDKWEKNRRGFQLFINALTNSIISPLPESMGTPTSFLLGPSFWAEAASTAENEWSRLNHAPGKDNPLEPDRPDLHDLSKVVGGFYLARIPYLTDRGLAPVPRNLSSNTAKKGDSRKKRAWKRDPYFVDVLMPIDPDNFKSLNPEVQRYLRFLQTYFLWTQLFEVEIKRQKEWAEWDKAKNGTNATIRPWTEEEIHERRQRLLNGARLVPFFVERHQAGGGYTIINAGTVGPNGLAMAPIRDGGQRPAIIRGGGTQDAKTPGMMFRVVERGAHGPQATVIFSGKKDEVKTLVPMLEGYFRSYVVNLDREVPVEREDLDPRPGYNGISENGVAVRQAVDFFPMREGLRGPNSFAVAGAMVEEQNAAIADSTPPGSSEQNFLYWQGKARSIQALCNHGADVWEQYSRWIGDAQQTYVVDPTSEDTYQLPNVWEREHNEDGSLGEPRLVLIGPPLLDPSTGQPKEIWVTRQAESIRTFADALELWFSVARAVPDLDTIKMLQEMHEQAENQRKARHDAALKAKGRAEENYRSWLRKYGKDLTPELKTYVEEFIDALEEAEQQLAQGQGEEVWVYFDKLRSRLVDSEGELKAWCERFESWLNGIQPSERETVHTALETYLAMLETTRLETLAELRIEMTGWQSSVNAIPADTNDAAAQGLRAELLATPPPPLETRVFERWQQAAKARLAMGEEVNDLLQRLQMETELTAEEARSRSARIYKEWLNGFETTEEKEAAKAASESFFAKLEEGHLATAEWQQALNAIPVDTDDSDTQSRRAELLAARPPSTDEEIFEIWQQSYSLFTDNALLAIGDMVNGLVKDRSGVDRLPLNELVHQAWSAERNPTREQRAALQNFRDGIKFEKKPDVDTANTLYTLGLLISNAEQRLHAMKKCREAEAALAAGQELSEDQRRMLGFLMPHPEGVNDSYDDEAQLETLLELAKIALPQTDGEKPIRYTVERETVNETLHLNLNLNPFVRLKKDDDNSVKGPMTHLDNAYNRAIFPRLINHAEGVYALPFNSLGRSGGVVFIQQPENANPGVVFVNNAVFAQAGRLKDNALAQKAALGPEGSDPSVQAFGNGNIRGIDGGHSTVLAANGGEPSDDEMAEYLRLGGTWNMTGLHVAWTEFGKSNLSPKQKEILYEWFSAGTEMASPDVSTISPKDFVDAISAGTDKSPDAAWALVHTNVYVAHGEIIGFYPGVNKYLTDSAKSNTKGHYDFRGRPTSATALEAGGKIPRTRPSLELTLNHGVPKVKKTRVLIKVPLTRLVVAKKVSASSDTARSLALPEMDGLTESNVFDVTMKSYGLLNKIGPDTDKRDGHPVKNFMESLPARAVIPPKRWGKKNPYVLTRTGHVVQGLTPLIPPAPFTAHPGGLNGYSELTRRTIVAREGAAATVSPDQHKVFMKALRDGKSLLAASDAALSSPKTKRHHGEVRKSAEVAKRIVEERKGHPLSAGDLLDVIRETQIVKTERREDREGMALPEKPPLGPRAAKRAVETATPRTKLVTRKDGTVAVNRDSAHAVFIAAARAAERRDLATEEREMQRAVRRSAAEVAAQPGPPDPPRTPRSIRKPQAAPPSMPPVSAGTTPTPATPAGHELSPVYEAATTTPRTAVQEPQIVAPPKPNRPPQIPTQNAEPARRADPSTTAPPPALAPETPTPTPVPRPHVPPPPTPPASPAATSAIPLASPVESAVEPPRPSTPSPLRRPNEWDDMGDALEQQLLAARDARRFPVSPSAAPDSNIPAGELTDGPNAAKDSGKSARKDGPGMEGR